MKMQQDKIVIALTLFLILNGCSNTDVRNKASHEVTNEVSDRMKNGRKKVSGFTFKIVSLIDCITENGDKEKS